MALIGKTANSLLYCPTFEDACAAPLLMTRPAESRIPSKGRALAEVRSALRLSFVADRTESDIGYVTELFIFYSLTFSQRLNWQGKKAVELRF